MTPTTPPEQPKEYQCDCCNSKCTLTLQKGRSNPPIMNCAFDKGVLINHRGLNWKPVFRHLTTAPACNNCRKVHLLEQNVEGFLKMVKEHDTRSRPASAPTTAIVKMTIDGELTVDQIILIDREWKKREASLKDAIRNEMLDALARDFSGRTVDDAVAEIHRFPKSLRQSTEARK